MRFKADLRAALAICAAIIGAGFASGREIVSFFSGLGTASYAGILTACAAAAGLIYVIMDLTLHTQAQNFPDLYGALMGVGCRDAMHILHALLCLTACAAMLSSGAELGALAFDLPFSRPLGLALTLCCALISVCTGLKSLSALGAVLVPIIAAYYLAMALNGRYAPEFSPDTLPVTLPMGVLYASFNIALTGGTICSAAQKNASPVRTASLTGILLFVLLCCANEAMLRAGDAFRRAAMPSVLLSMQWGVSGYYITLFVMWLSVLTTLCALLHSMRAQLTALRLSPAASLLLPALSALLLSACGLDALIDAGYPLLGWICCCALFALLLFLPKRAARITPPCDTFST